MSAAIRTMAGHPANATGARRVSGAGMCAGQWSADGIAITVNVADPVFTYTKLHDQRPKEASP